MAWPRVVTWIAPSLALFAAAVAGTVAFAAGVDAGWLAATLLLGLPGLVLGPLIARSRPHDAAGAFLAAAGLVLVVVGAGNVVMAAGLASPQDFGSTAVLVATMSQGIWMFLYVPWALVLLCFPAGRIEGRTRWIAAVLVATAAVFTLVAPWAGPYDEPVTEHFRILPPAAWAPAVGYPLVGLFMVCLLLCAVTMLRRYRHGDGRTRGQIRWLAVAAAVVPETLLLCWIGGPREGGGLLLGIGLSAMYTVVPAAVAVALLRADAVVSGSLPVRVAAGFAGAATVGGLAALAGFLFKGKEPLTAATVVAAAATVLVLVSWHQLNHVLGLWLDPENEHVLSAIAKLQSRIAAGEAVPEELAAVLASALGDPGLQVGLVPLTGDGGTELYGVAGLPSEAGQAAPIILGRQVIGAVRSSNGGPRREALAAAAPMVELARHRQALAAALAEAQAGRERIVRAAHEERRRLERDLHDGVQQQLVALGLSLRLIQRHLPAGASDAAAALDEGVDDLAAAIAEIRRIARGLQPGSLDDGLSSALRQLAGRPGAPVGLELSGPLEAAPEIVRATVYFVASEAVVNASKHASATRVQLRAEGHSGGVWLHVSDDGAGGAVARAGGGLAGLADRVAALGGTFSLLSPRGGGTVVEAWLPCDL
ncbi:histidine kinase [Arthrobacter sp. GMC3]|uniref:sensor histidine kinase n=1 Tax=Arthrobacter sp. GMC3 TaxID=2058894 RepID=UPI0011B041D0|nr:histidine kinase [Arthrobacter sp. GMC3]